MDVLSSKLAENGRRTVQMIHVATASDGAMWMQIIDQFARQAWSVAHVAESSGTTFDTIELAVRPRRDAARHSVFNVLLRLVSVSVEIPITATLRARSDAVAEADRSPAMLSRKFAAAWERMDELAASMQPLRQRLRITDEQC